MITLFSLEKTVSVEYNQTLFTTILHSFARACTPAKFGVLVDSVGRATEIPWNRLFVGPTFCNKLHELVARQPGTFFRRRYSLRHDVSMSRRSVSLELRVVPGNQSFHVKGEWRGKYGVEPGEWNQVSGEDSIARFRRYQYVSLTPSRNRRRHKKVSCGACDSSGNGSFLFRRWRNTSHSANHRWWVKPLKEREIINNTKV